MAAVAGVEEKCFGTHGLLRYLKLRADMLCLAGGERSMVLNGKKGVGVIERKNCVFWWAAKGCCGCRCRLEVGEVLRGEHGS